LRLFVLSAIPWSPARSPTPTASPAVLFDDMLAVVDNRQISRLVGLVGHPSSRVGRPCFRTPARQPVVRDQLRNRGLNVAGYHVWNITVHLLCGLLLSRWSAARSSCGQEMSAQAGHYVRQGSPAKADTTYDKGVRLKPDTTYDFGLDETLHERGLPRR